MVSLLVYEIEIASLRAAELACAKLGLHAADATVKSESGSCAASIDNVWAHAADDSSGYTSRPRTPNCPMDAISTLAMAAGLSWASGLRLYAVLFLAGGAHAVGWVSLPAALQVLAHPLVLTASGGLLAVEFLADKVPGLDTIWDGIHTFIRIPAGALLAIGAFGPADAPTAVAAALLGATLAGGSHFTKAGGRLILNASPEPVSNWTASFTEDALAPATLLLAFKYPLVFFAALALFIGVSLWLLPKLYRALRGAVRRVSNALGARAR